MNTQIMEEPSDRQFDEAVGTFKLLSDPTRLRIVWALLHGEHSVNNLADHVGVPAASVSQHLAKLRLSRLVRTRRDGTRIFYLVDDEHVRELAEAAVRHVGHASAEASSQYSTRANRAGGR